MAAVKEFTTEDLRANNGKDRPTAYVAYKGKVYDVSGSKLWKNGLHMRRHQAGGDLTAEMSAAPHGPEILQRVPELGVIEPEKSAADENIPDVLLQLFEKWPTLRRHPHPMTVHFPLAFCLAVPLFDLLSLIFDKPGFAHTAFQLLVLAIPSTALAMMTGPYAWWVNYGARMNFNIAVKMTCSSVLFLLLLAGCFWRLSTPDVMLAGGIQMWGCFLLSCSYALLVVVLGWFGAKMTFPA